jgi:hypothetical protein
MAQTLSTMPSRRRRIAPKEGRALEILGHAIEYLTDEYVHAGGSFAEQDPAVEAIRLLTERNREIYLSCPEIPGWRTRCASWVRSGRRVFQHKK